MTDSSLEIKLARWEKVFGLMKDLSIPLGDIEDVQMVENPLREAMRAGLKAGLRMPGYSYVARTIRLDQVIVVRRGAPGLSFAVRNRGPLERVLVSTPEAKALAKRLRSGRGTAAA
jgi:hypothetical protein